MRTRKAGPLEVSAIGLGCMSMSHAYGVPDEAEAEKALHHALDIGYNFLDTAALYGFGKNEELIGRVLKERRGEYILASKCGMFRGPDGKRAVDGRPEVIRRTCEDSLRRLRTEVIDLYYLHRWDRNVPVEDSIGTMADLVKDGKVRELGISEVSAETLRKAHAEHPMAALQTEYSLMSRNPEIAVLDACRELGIAFVAFSPLGRGLLTGTLRDAESQLPATDIRRRMPRFREAHFSANLSLLDEFESIAEENACAPAQLALAWLLSRGDHVIPIPGTKHTRFAKENFRAMDVALSDETLSRLDALINQDTVSGARYDATTQEEIDTEQFPGE